MNTKNVPILSAKDAAYWESNDWNPWDKKAIQVVRKMRAIATERAVVVSAAELAALRQRLAEAERDAARLDFLESLMKRTGTFGHKKTVWPLDTDIHIGSRGTSIYARTGIGSDTEFAVGGTTVRAAIDAAIAKESGT